jgi:hypothetical protein
MEVITNYGSFEFDEIEDLDLSSEAEEFLSNHKNAVELFFGDEIDLTDVDNEDQSLVQEIMEELAGGNFSEPERAFALSEWMGAHITDITEDKHDIATFQAGGGEYLVLTEDEADEKAEDYASTYYEGLDPESVMYALEHHGFDSEFIDTSWFDDAMHEYNESYAFDIKEESASEPYINRLHEEMCSRGVLSEPEWPDEDDFTHEREEYEREEFDEDEPMQEDYDSEDEWQEAYSEWEDAQSEFESEQDIAEDEHNLEQDRLEEEAEENYEAAKSEYESELESDIENAIDEFIDLLDGDYDDGLEYFKDHFGNSEVSQIIKNHDLADLEALGKQLLDDEGRGYFLASYDNNEDYATSTYKGQDYEFYFYRTN